MNPSRIILEGGYNARDLGAQPAGDGLRTRSRVLVRSGNLDKLTPAAVQQLLDYGIRTVIDLRDEWETHKSPNKFAASDAVTYLNLPLMGETLAKNPAWLVRRENYHTPDELYVLMLDACRPQIGRIVSALADSEFGTIVHCHAGKDRTGIVTALVLSAMGVPDDAIAADYAATEGQITELLSKERAYAVEHGKLEQFERGAGARPETMLRMLDALRQQFGGAAAYLESCGVTAAQLARLREHFVAPADA